MGFIHFNEATKIFSLNTKNSTYQMQIRDLGVLCHLYYGGHVGDTEIDYRIVNLNRGFSGNPHDIGDADRTYSMDTLPQEYTGYGNGDYRINGIAIANPDGSDVVDLRYESHEIVDGKYSLKGLPHMFGTAEEAQTLIINMVDSVSQVKVQLLYGVFYELDVITRTCRMINESKKPLRLKRFMSMEMDFENRLMDYIHFYGRHAMERETERLPVGHGVHLIESKRGMSSHQHNPFLILCDKQTDEEHGDAFGFSFIYSGNFRIEMEMDQIDQLRIVAGIHPYHFSYVVAPGQSFEAPEVAMAYSGEGLGQLSRVYHDAYRSNLIRSKWVNRPRPILVNNWEATYFDFDEEKIYGIAKQAKEIGLDMLVLDDGWFGDRNTDFGGLGDWYVNEDKLKGGLPKLVKRVKDLGLKFGLWIEPEMVSEESRLFKEHPTWLMRVPKRGVERSRGQLNLDITRKDVRDHIMNMIFDVIDKAGIDYIKWDFNRSLGNIYSLALPVDKQGEVFHRYMLGLYDMMERLVSRYPDLLLETCAGGGGRFDAGMLYYSPQIWTSDDTDAFERVRIQYGTSFGYPISCMGSHVSVCPNHQTGRITPFETRGVVASAGTFGYELDLEKLTPEEKDLARQQILDYKAKEHIIQNGDYYRLTNPYDNREYAAWMFISKDKTEAIVNGVVLHSEPNSRIHILHLRGLDENLHYKEEKTGRVYTGAALMRAGIPLPVEMGDYRPIVFNFKAV